MARTSLLGKTTCAFVGSLLLVPLGQRAHAEQATTPILAPPAGAPKRTKAMLSAPLTIGPSRTLGHDWGLSIGVRPEVIVARLKGAGSTWSGPGLGVYGELSSVLTERDERWLGAGATVAYYGESERAFAISGGIARTRERGVVPSFGLFVGWRLKSLSADTGLPLDVLTPCPVSSASKESSNASAIA